MCALLQIPHLLFGRFVVYNGLIESDISIVFANKFSPYMTDRRTFISRLGLAGGALAASAALGSESASSAPAHKVLLVNGSPHMEGCTYTALSLVAEELKAAGIETEIFYLGPGPFHDCIACGSCHRKPGQCVLKGDCVNELIAKAREAQGFVFGSPVYYGHPSGRLLSVMDRAFYAAGSAFAGKPAAAVASSRRAGSLATLDAIQKHFTISQMPVVSSFYWNEVHGNSPEQVLEDAEGVSIMRQLGRNLARAVKAYAAEPALPTVERRVTNFIR